MTGRIWPRGVGIALAVLMFWFASGPGGGTWRPDRRDGYAIPQPGRQFVFPRDPQAVIRNLPSEWWYVTGHLVATNQSQFGFQATFFRRALTPPGATNNSASAAFGNDQIYLAHMALVEKTTGIFRYQERLNRAGWDAAAATNTLNVRNGNWSLRLAPEKSGAGEIFQLQATVGAEAAIVLNLVAEKIDAVVFGTNGGLAQGG